MALLFKSLPAAHTEVVQGERGDYGSVTSDFSLLLLIASIVWKASCREVCDSWILHTDLLPLTEEMR